MKRMLLLQTVIIAFILGVAAIANSAMLPPLAAGPHYKIFDSKVHHFRATDPLTGDPVADGMHPMSLSIWDDSTGGVMLWSEGSIVETKDGLGQFLFGLTNPISLDVMGVEGNTDRVLYMEITFEGEVLSPRQLLGAVPYANISSRVLGDIETGVGKLSVVPQTAGTYEFELTVTDNNGSLNLNNLTSTSQKGVELAVDDSSSKVSVIPPTAGTYEFELKVTDNAGLISLGRQGPSQVQGLTFEFDNTGSDMRVTPPTAGTYEFELIVSDNSALAGLKQGGGDRGITFEIPNDSPRIHIFDAIDLTESTIEPGIYEQSIPGISYARVSVDSLKGGALGLGLIGDTDLDLSAPGGLVIVGGGDSARLVQGELQLVRNVGSVRDVLALLPSQLSLTSSDNVGVVSHEIQLRGGAGGGRIALVSEPLTVPIEIVSLSLVSVEPVMAMRSENSSPSDLPAFEWDFDFSDHMFQKMRSGPAHQGDSCMLGSTGLELYDFPMEYFYDVDGTLYRDASLAQTNYQVTPAGNLTVRGRCDLALGAGNNVGVGVVSPPFKLFVDGDICATGAIGPCSDARFKKNVSAIESALEIVKRIDGVKFDWRTDEFPDYNFSEDRQVGLIAQDVIEVLPEIVIQGSDGYYSVDYSRLTPVLVEAVKEQQKKIESLEARLAKANKLEKEVAELKEMVTALAKSNTDSKSDKLASNQ